MADAILYNVAATILENLGSATLGRDLGLIFSAADDLRKLKNTVSAIKAVLLDAEEKQDKNHQLKDWIRKLQDAFDSADDLLDDFHTEVMWRRVAFGGGGLAAKFRIFFSPSNQIAFELKIGGRLKQVRKRLEEIDNDRKSFHLQEGFEDKTGVLSRSRESHSFVRDDEVVGREQDKSVIVERLLSTNSHLEVVPIVGIGGLGKTTLAQLVFKDQKVCDQFKLRIWVYVSEAFDLKSLLEKILKAISYQSPGDLQLDQLQNQVREKITSERFLLVLDDVNDVDSEKWINLERLLGSSENGSRVLVTTRSEMVAEIVTQRAHLWQYKLRGLDEPSSLHLFKRAAFGKGPESKNPRLVEMGMKILGKCHGVPLAIKTIGGTLFSKTRESDWHLITDNELINISQGPNGIFPSLKISYSSLPSRLKHCFAYCRLFPKDHELDVQKLIRLWIAQGFVDPSDDRSRTQSLEDIGYGYFMDLLRRSFFQEPVLDEWGNVKRCKIHSLMHDLAAVVAGQGSVKIDKDTESLDVGVRHLSFDFKFNESWKVLESWMEKKKNNKNKDANLRTFISPNQNVWKSLRRLDRGAMLLNLVSLRTLDLKALGIEELRSDLGNLRHLRYLDLSQNRFKLLPDSIIRLQNLQTLILSNCRELVKLPHDTKRLVGLRHLHLNGCRSLTHMPPGLRELTSLHSLDRFVVADESDDAASLGELEKLDKLSYDLSIENLGHKKSTASESKATNLKDKKNLRSLVLFWKNGFNSGDDSVNDKTCLDDLQPHSNLKALKVVNYLGSKFCDWLSSLESLVKLELASCENCCYLPPLDKLPCLKDITLFALNALEYVFDEPSSSSSSSLDSPFFPSLTSLKIRFCINLKRWSKATAMTSSKFPCLHDLDIRNCPQFVSMPLFPSLRSLELIDTSFEPLKETMMMKNSQSPLLELKSLSISQINDLEDFPNEIGNLKSLESISLVGCGSLKSLPAVVGDLTSLQSLRIRECLKMESLPVVMSVPPLKLLEIENCPLLVTQR